MPHHGEGGLPFSGGAPALDAYTAMRRAEARLARLEAQLDAVERAVSSLRDSIDDEAAVRRGLVAEHTATLEAEARDEYGSLTDRLEAVRDDYDALAAGLDETMRRHASRELDDAAFATAQREAGDALRAKAAELAHLDRLRLRFETELGGEPSKRAVVAPAPPPPLAPSTPPPLRPAPPIPAPPIPAAPTPARPTPPLDVATVQWPTPPAPQAPAAPPLAGVPFPPPLPTPIPLSSAIDDLQAVLVEAHEASSGAAHVVHDGLQIGRAIENELRVLDPSVSRQHATIVVRSGSFVLEDLQSQNGTFVNGERVHQRVLCDGDRIGIGEAAFVFRTGTAEPGEDGATT